MTGSDIKNERKDESASSDNEETKKSPDAEQNDVKEQEKTSSAKEGADDSGNPEEKSDRKDEIPNASSCNEDDKKKSQDAGGDEDTKKSPDANANDIKEKEKPSSTNEVSDADDSATPKENNDGKDKSANASSRHDDDTKKSSDEKQHDTKEKEKSSSSKEVVGADDSGTPKEKSVGKDKSVTPSSSDDEGKKKSPTDEAKTKELVKEAKDSDDKEAVEPMEEDVLKEDEKDSEDKAINTQVGGVTEEGGPKEDKKVSEVVDGNTDKTGQEENMKEEIGNINAVFMLQDDEEELEDKTIDSGNQVSADKEVSEAEEKTIETEKEVSDVVDLTEDTPQAVPLQQEATTIAGVEEDAVKSKSKYAKFEERIQMLIDYKAEHGNYKVEYHHNPSLYHWCRDVRGNRIRLNEEQKLRMRQMGLVLSELGLLRPKSIKSEENSQNENAASDEEDEDNDSAQFQQAAAAAAEVDSDDEGEPPKRKRYIRFDERIFMLLNYKAEHGHLNVEMRTDPSLYKWLRDVRYGKYKLKDEQRQQLVEIGILGSKGGGKSKDIVLTPQQAKILKGTGHDAKTKPMNVIDVKVYLQCRNDASYYTSQFRNFLVECDERVKSRIKSRKTFIRKEVVDAFREWLIGEKDIPRKKSASCPIYFFDGNVGSTEMASDKRLQAYIQMKIANLKYKARHEAKRQVNSKNTNKKRARESSAVNNDEEEQIQKRQKVHDRNLKQIKASIVDLLQKQAFLGSFDAAKCYYYKRISEVITNCFDVYSEAIFMLSKVYEKDVMLCEMLLKEVNTDEFAANVTEWARSNYGVHAPPATVNLHHPEYNAAKKDLMNWDWEEPEPDTNASKSFSKKDFFCLFCKKILKLLLKEETELRNEVIEGKSDDAIKEMQKRMVKMIKQLYGQVLEKVKLVHEEFEKNA